MATKNRSILMRLVAAIFLSAIWLLIIAAWAKRVIGGQPMAAAEWIIALGTVFGVGVVWRMIRNDFVGFSRREDVSQSRMTGNDVTPDMTRLSNVRLRFWMLLPVLFFAMLLPVGFLLLDVADKGEGLTLADWLAFLVGEVVAVVAVGAGWLVAKRLSNRRNSTDRES